MQSQVLISIAGKSRLRFVADAGLPRHAVGTTWSLMLVVGTMMVSNLENGRAR
jgi:hypothetical protein